MRKISKSDHDHWVTVIVARLFFFGMIENQQAVDLPFYLIPLREYPWVGASMSMFFVLDMCRLCTADDHWYFRCLVLSKAFGSFGYPAKIRRIGDSKESLGTFCFKRMSNKLILSIRHQ